MGYVKRKPTVMIWFAAVILIVLAVLMMILLNKKAALPENWLFTVDGYAVTDEEFLFYINDQRAVTVDYFNRTYGAQVDEGFWSRQYGANQETPSEYAKKICDDCIAKGQTGADYCRRAGYCPIQKF
ncbi:hypothetical protein AZ66_08765 [Paenibacillus sp. E194]|uniref:hypothetical protein n=1 Tax=Paenibacillus sp. E194 TaxID=1458845 RepID=UPI0005C88ED2|nr:hypothetical protein [Paenibacillus sp. E194]KJB88186.1 hypothetical protein AZ66_08765 [Paenibacillus sp. E194]